MSAAAPFVWVVVGSPGSGKSSLIRIALPANQPRVMIFDPMREFGAFGVCENLTNMIARISAAGAGPFALVYQPDTSDPARIKQKFDVFCKLAFAAGNVLAVVDEAADVTSPNRYEVPEGWSTLLRQGRHRSVRILAATQRPADIDKRLWTFATRIRTVGSCGFAIVEMRWKPQSACCYRKPLQHLLAAGVWKFPEQHSQMLRQSAVRIC